LDLTNEEYKRYVKEMSPKSPMWKDLFHAFWIGGLICVIGELVSKGWTALGLSETNAGSATSATMVLFGALLTGLNLYGKIAKKAGAGTLVPITGFANSIVSPALEFKTEGFVNGVGAKMFIIAGPVLVYGISASVIYGVILYLLSFL
jgi:stage V sporulation protein AC